MGMLSLEKHHPDSFLWEFIAYCAGTGGSILIIGSAAGVAAMGLEKIHFFWYVRHISGLALLGYFGGAAAYIMQDWLLHWKKNPEEASGVFGLRGLFCAR